MTRNSEDPAEGTNDGRPPPEQGDGCTRPKKKKSTARQIRARVFEICELLCHGSTKGEIKAAFKKQYGLGYRTVERYIRLAREAIAERVEDGDRKQRFAESYWYWMSVLRNPSARVRDKNFARRHLDQLLGLYAPQKIAMTTPDGDAPAPFAIPVMAVEVARSMSDDQLRALQAMRDLTVPKLNSNSQEQSHEPPAGS